LHGQDSDLMSARSQRVHKPFGVNGQSARMWTIISQNGQDT
jgi:hypothetical protein